MVSHVSRRERSIQYTLVPSLVLGPVETRSLGNVASIDSSVYSVRSVSFLTRRYNSSFAGRLGHARLRHFPRNIDERRSFFPNFFCVMALIMSL